MIRRGCILGVLLAFLPAVSQAAVMFMIDGVPGPAKLPGYGGWFVADAYSVGVDRGNAAKPQAIEVHMTQEAAVATLFQVGAGMGTFKKIVLDVIDIDGDSSSTIKLLSRLTCEEATLRQIAASAEGDERGKTELAFSCGKMIWDGYDYDAQTKALAKASKGTWNFKTNTP